MMKFLWLTMLLTGPHAFAATYYVDWVNGNDTNNGTSKSTPWKRAPGMNACASTCNSQILNAGDSVILKGCVTWPNAAFTWVISQSGASPNSVYYGVDQTWWDSTVSGCSSSWNRPIFNLGNSSPTDSLNRIIDITGHDITVDNFEMTNMAANWNSINGTTSAIAWDGSGNTVVEHMYFHGWNNPCVSVGTGNLVAGTNRVTNYVPFSYSPSPNTTWASGSGICGHAIQLQNPGNVTGQHIPLGNTCPTVTSVTGTNPYTILFTCNTTVSSNCTGCLIQLGADFMNIVGGVNSPNANHGDMMYQNVVNPFLVQSLAEAQWNPYPDCGFSESNNNMCMAGGTASWRQPNIWRENVIRYVFSAAVSTCTEWSGNTIEYLRGQGPDPTLHNNAIECAGNDNPINNATFFYNNLFQHLNNPNPNTPTGVNAIGLGNIQPSPVSGETVYEFNNVMNDTLANTVFQLAVQSGTPKQVIFNNSVNCGVTALGLIQNCVETENLGDVISNNYYKCNFRVFPIWNVYGACKPDVFSRLQ